MSSSTTTTTSANVNDDDDIRATHHYNYCLNVQLFLKPEERENFLSIMKYDQEQSLLTEPDCLQFVLGEDIETPNVFYLHEEYTNEAAFQAHTQTAHFAKWKSYCSSESPPWTTDGGPPIVDFYLGKTTHSTTTTTTTTTATTKRPASVVPNLFCLNVKLYPRPSLRDTFLTVIDANQKGSTETEPLCLQYVYGESTQMPNTFFFHEEYQGEDQGKEGFIAHQQTPHFAGWEAFANDKSGDGEGVFTKPPIVQLFRTI
jgi:(4S)-4-hydroxy-5-phosphonooxypentane-2,3-dione isomerase